MTAVTETVETVESGDRDAFVPWARELGAQFAPMAAGHDRDRTR